MNGSDKQLYFVAIIPPDPIYKEALELKEYFRDRYNSKASLNSPPHITLHMPFRYNVKKEEKLIRFFEDFSKDFKSFPLSLKDFGAFSPRVIYMAVEPNETLDELQKELHIGFKQKLHIFNANYKEYAYHPHLTLAFRDLRKPAFREAWQEFKDKTYHGDFRVEKITLLKHNGKNWEVFREFGNDSRSDFSGG